MHESIEVKQLRSRLGSYLNQVQDGLTLVVTRQGQAIAELRPYDLEQASLDVQDVIPDEAPPQRPAAAGVSALGLTTYVCQMGPPNHLAVPDEVGEVGEVANEDTNQAHAMPELQAQQQEEAQESRPEQAMQIERAAAVTSEAESAEMVSPPPAKPAQRMRPSRARSAKTAASPKRRQSQGASARKKSS